MILKRRSPANYDDQTGFASGSLLYESISRPAAEEDEADTKSKRRKSVLLGVGILLLLIGLVAAYALYRQRGNGASPINEPDVSDQQQVELTPFRRRLSELETDLEQADPGQENLPFPPIDLELNLTE